MTETDTDTDNDSTATKTTRELEDEVFSEGSGYSSDPIEARKEVLRERVERGDDEAAEKLASWGDDGDDGSGGLVKALDDTDGDTPEWALALAEQVERNGERLDELRRSGESAPDPFTL